MKKIIFLVLSLFLVGCTPISGNSFVSEDKVKVVATVGMIGDMVRNIGGDLVEVKDLMGPGVDPHLYKPSTGDVSLLSQADVVFFGGLHLEGKMVDMFENLAKEKPVVAVSESIEKSNLRETAEFAGNYDPHVWFDVSLWREAADSVLEELVAYDSANAEVYKANAEKYFLELEELDKWVRAEALKLPKEARVLITAHDAFGYFGRAYGFEVVGLQGISTASEYGLEDVEKVVNLIVDRKLKAIFVESSVSSKSIQAVQEGVKSKGWDVVIGGQLFSDAMGDAGTEEGTYVGMVKHNVSVIVNSLK